MNLVERAKSIILQPKNEWEVIAVENTATSEIYQKYIIPLAIIPAVASFIGMSVVGVSVPFLGTVRTPILSGLVASVVSFALALVGVFVLSLIIDALAPNFGGEKNSSQAFKVAAYSYTPGWLAGALSILPALTPLILLASLYGLYLLYLGLPVLMKSAKEKSAAYTAIVVVCAVILSLVFGALTGAMSGFGNTMGNMPHMGANSTGTSGNETIDQMKKMSVQMEEAGKKMEEAQKSGDPNAQMKAANEMLGALNNGASKVEQENNTDPKTK